MRAHRSHSQLNAYLHCAHQFYLQRVLRKPEGPTVWLPAGKAFHTATEEFDLDVFSSNDGSPVGASAAYYQDVFTKKFEEELDAVRADFPDESTWRRAGRATKEKPEKETVAVWHELGRELMGMYVDWRVSTADIWEIATVNAAPGIEVEVTHPLGGVPMKGYVDRVLRSKEDGRLVVADLKTGTRTPASPMQLATYSIQLEKLMGEPVLWGAWYEARKGTLSVPIDLSNWTEQRLGKVYNDLDRGIEAGVFLPHIDTHCVSCGVRQFCIYQGGNEVG